MSSHILLATVAAIALSTPAWADDPAEGPIDTEIKAIVFDPGEAPIDTEMKIILWLENIEAPLWENTAGGDDAARSALSTGTNIAQYQTAPTHENVAAK
jgi:hypothetical protein